MRKTFSKKIRYSSDERPCRKKSTFRKHENDLVWRDNLQGKERLYKKLVNMQICKATPQKGDFYGRSHLRRICPCHSVMLQWFLYKSLYILEFQTATIQIPPLRIIALKCSVNPKSNSPLIHYSIV